MSHYLAFDLGASSGRAILGSLENGRLKLEEVHRFPNHPKEKDGHFYWDIAELAKELETGLQKAFAAAGDIVSFSVDTWGVDTVYMRNGQPVRNPSCYRDERFIRAQQDVHTRISGQELFTESGIQLLAFNTIYQMYAHAEDYPEDFADGTKMLFIPDALIALLTGQEATEYTIASTGALLNPQTRQWNTELLERLEIPVNVLTGLLQPGTRGAMLKPELCERLGIPAIPCVRCGSHDTASAIAALPQPDTAECAYISLGTWALLGAELREPNLSTAAFTAHYTNEGGVEGTIRFLTNITGTWLLQETRRILNETEPTTFSRMCEMAQAAGETAKRFDPNDPVFSTPGDIPARIRQYMRETNQGEFSSTGELIRCIYESLADAFRDKLQELEKTLGMKYRTLNILGGGTKDEFLMQLAANRTGINVAAGPVEATAAGNLIVQMTAAGEIPDLRSARKVIAETFPPVVYRPE